MKAKTTSVAVFLILLVMYVRADDMNSEGSGSGQDEGSGSGQDNGSGEGSGTSEDNGSGQGSDNGQGNGSGQGSGNGQGNGNGQGSGNGQGNGNGQGSGSNQDNEANGNEQGATLIRSKELTMTSGYNFNVGLVISEYQKPDGTNEVRMNCRVNAPEEPWFLDKKNLPKGYVVQGTDCNSLQQLGETQLNVRQLFELDQHDDDVQIIFPPEQVTYDDIINNCIAILRKKKSQEGSGSGDSSGMEETLASGDDSGSGSGSGSENDSGSGSGSGSENGSGSGDTSDATVISTSDRQPRILIANPQPRLFLTFSPTQFDILSTGSAITITFRPSSGTYSKPIRIVNFSSNNNFKPSIWNGSSLLLPNVTTALINSISVGLVILYAIVLLFPNFGTFLTRRYDTASNNLKQILNRNLYGAVENFAYRAGLSIGKLRRRMQKGNQYLKSKRKYNNNFPESRQSNVWQYHQK